MITVQLNDKRLIENVKALEYLKSLNRYSEKELQRMYDKQVESDREREENDSNDGYNHRDCGTYSCDTK